MQVQKFLELEEVFLVSKAQALFDAIEHWATCLVAEYSCGHEAQFRTDDGYVAPSWPALRKVIHQSLDDDLARLLANKGLLPEQEQD